jgi:hypothetical protein
MPSVPSFAPGDPCYGLPGQGPVNGPPLERAAGLAAVAVLLLGVLGSVVAAQAWRATVSRQRDERLDRTAASRTVTISGALGQLRERPPGRPLPVAGLRLGQPPRVQRLRPQPRPAGPLRRAPGDRLAPAGHRRRAGRVRGRDPGGRRAELHHQAARPAARPLRHPVQLPAAPLEQAARRRRPRQPGPPGHPRGGPRRREDHRSRRRRPPGRPAVLRKRYGWCPPPAAVVPARFTTKPSKERIR